MPFGMVSDLIGTGINAYAQHREAKLSREWQERVIKNQKQWQVNDLRAAGLNPILASGMNTVAPSGATASGNVARTSGTEQYLASRRKKEGEVADANLDVLDSAKNKNNADAVKAAAEARKAQAETTNIEANTEKTLKSTAQIPTLSQAEVDNITKSQHSTWVGSAIRDVWGFVLGTVDNIQTVHGNDLEDKVYSVLREKMRTDPNITNSSSIPSLSNLKEIAHRLAEKIRKEANDKASSKWSKTTSGVPSGPPRGGVY